MALASGLTLAGGAEGNDPLGGDDRGTGELIDQGDRAGRPHGARRPRRLGDDRRRARRVCRRSAAPAPAARRRPAGRLRRAHPLRRRRGGVRPAEGGDAGAGPAAPRPPRASRRSLPGRARRRRASTSTAAARPAAWPAGCSPSAPGCCPVSTSSPTTSTSTTRLDAADVVVTGEGFLDAQSLDGKVVGGVYALAARAWPSRRRGRRRRRRRRTSTARRHAVVSLVDEFGARAFDRTAVRASSTPCGARCWTSLR